MIRLENISYQYKQLKVLDNLSLEVEKDHFTCLIGNTGSGKSTLLRIIAGLEKPDKGSVWLRDQLVAKEGSNLVAPEARKLGFIFQDLALWPHFTVIENVGFGLKMQKEKNWKEKAGGILSRFSLESHAHKYPHQLSGGQQQLVALARSIVLQPDILLLDEPLSNLDVQLREQMMHYLLELKDQLQITFFYITHDPREAMKLADNIVVLGNSGQIAYSGKKENVYHSANPFVQSFLKVLQI